MPMARQRTLIVSGEFIITSFYADADGREGMRIQLPSSLPELGKDLSNTAPLFSTTAGQRPRQHNQEKREAESRGA